MASPDTFFQLAMNDMKDINENNRKYLEADGTQRQWMIPTAFAASFEPLDVSALGDAFDRQQLNADYQAEYDGTGEDEVRVVMGLSTQLGYLAIMERAYRERYKTMPRVAAHTTGRTKAHGDANGIHTGSILPYIQELFTA